QKSVEGARREAGGIVEKARQVTVDLLEGAKREAKEMEKRLIKERTLKAQEEVESLKKANKKKIEELRDQAAKNMERAVSFIVDKISGG
nr:hypothetical protein [Deltaproteobacteria bacterium]